MSIDKFSSDPSNVKLSTNRESDGVGRTTSPVSIGSGNPAPYYEVSVQDKPGAGSDQTIVHTGPGAGVVGGIGNQTDLQGFISPTGNKILIDNNFGSDTITLQHHSGATIMIDADGSIHMISSGKKGVGLIAPRGDGTVYAKGHLILKGDGRVTIESIGDLDINVGGNLGINVGGDMITIVNGSSEESIDGSKAFEVAKDMSTMIAGDNRITSAGKTKIQASQSIDIDAGKDIFARTDGAMSLQAQKEFTALSLTAMNLGTKTTLNIKAEGNLGIDTKGTLTVKSSGATSIQSGGSLDTMSSGAHKISSQGGLTLNASGTVSIAGSITNVQTGGSSPSSPTAPSDAGEASLAQYAPSETIIDSITSMRLAPDFPVNSKRLSKEQFSLYKNEGGNPNPKAEAFASPNSGAGMVVTPQTSGSADPAAVGAYDRPAGISTGTGTAEQNPYPLPTSIYNSNEKLSRHITIGQVIGLRAVPASQHKSVLTEAANVAWNIIDPIIERFGGRVQLTSWYRSNSGNHITGGAVDLRCSNKNDTGFTAEIAAYVRDNLPYSKILLEKNDSPGIHVHLESAKPGSPGGGTVLTCADPQCRSTTPGLQLSFALAALNKTTGAA